MKRLQEQLPPGFEMSLLHSATLENPSSEAKEKAFQATMAAAGALTATTFATSSGSTAAGSSALATSTSTWVSFSWVKWTMISLATSAAFVGWKALDAPPTQPHTQLQTQIQSHSHSQIQTLSSVPVTEAPKPAPVVQLSPASKSVKSLKTSLPATHVDRKVSSATEAPRKEASTLAEELQQLTGARSALSENRAGEALTRARGYTQRWPQGSFVTEAEWLEMESLLQLKQFEEAHQVLQRFQERHPEPFHVQQIEVWQHRLDQLSKLPNGLHP